MTTTNNTTIDVSTMFDYSSGANIPWNICQYLPKRQYLDPNQIKFQNQTQQQKYIRQPTNPPQTINQKTFFLDQQIKPYKNNPSPDKYQSLSIFDQKQNRKKSLSIKINPRLSKYTYLDLIQIESKKRKQPSVGKYNITKTQKQIQEDIKAISGRKHSYDQKRHFYDGNQTNTVPGAGMYNPHLEVWIEPKPTKKTYKWWIEQHTKLAIQQRKKQRKSLAPNSYRPISASFNSFDKIEIDLQKQKKKIKDKSKSKKINPRLGFTSADSRFDYMKEKKCKILEKRPASTTYDTFIEWKGKKDTNPKKKGWARCLSAGPARSIYH